ncbi:hypothetical protein [Leadbettera azotonutricia]|uniref:Uncharacterized protein n=1 Tax=Leadbettera azotonutricia (strain ATCC BAA-888 / DSM 13862 / ZAS-9) TaxID=545695 RepID=F5YBA4_LEAAZ|nr:hypothetical protein [Leadbettera azotonutricia]AEF81511.1 hypothetical protein TREAZ_1905 [Leadbettera azotonutricia ZAS-9]
MRAGAMRLPDSGAEFKGKGDEASRQQSRVCGQKKAPTASDGAIGAYSLEMFV